MLYASLIICLLLNYCQNKLSSNIGKEVKPKNDYPIGHPKFWQDISIEALVEGDKEYSQWQDRDAMWMSMKR